MKRKPENLIVLAAVLTIILVDITSAKLVAYYTFENGTAVNVGGSAGSAADGTLKGGATIVLDSGGGLKEASNVLSIKGYPQHVNCGGGKKAGESQTWADFPDSITVAAWIKPDIPGSNVARKFRTVISKSSPGGFTLNREDDSDNISFHAAALGVPWKGLSGSNPKVWDGKWHHVAGVYSTVDSPDTNGVWKRGLYIYVDGVECGFMKRWGEPVILNNFDVIIGGNADCLEKGNTFRYWQGLIDDVAIFDHALKPDEIYSLYVPALQKLTDVIEETESIINKQGHEKGRAFLKNKIAEYEKWKKENPDNIKFRYDILASDLYVLLAKANIENLSNAQNPQSNIYKQAKSEVNWTTFKLFLDTVFAEAKKAVDSTKPGESSQESKVVLRNLLKECESKSELIRYLVEQDSELAEKYITNGDFRKAAEIYFDIAGRYDFNQDKQALEFKACECIFNGGEYRSAISELERFITRNKGIDESLAAKAILLKGQSFLQLNDYDKASEEFVSLKTQYPKSKEIPATDFYIGYYHMLKNENKEAIEIFYRVVQEHPESPYANKARMCIMRIEGMAGD
ncbi:MAG: LamG-like jellyroll fold domain-containing protein [Planctomycetota bacterium]|jgi:outer membrane protein assembly factor BamD (BamD/ComL family)